MSGSERSHRAAKDVTRCQRGRFPRVAIVFTTSPVTEMMGSDPQHPLIRAFVHELRDLGWVDGRTIVIERKSAEGKWDRAPDIFAELVRQRIDVIVTVDVSFVRAAKHATSTIPIVSAGSTGLVEHGLVASLSRPGGNITGLEDQMTPDLGAKTVQLFREVLPGARRFAVLAGPRWASWVGEVRRLVEPTGVRLVAIGDETEGGLRAAFRTLRRGRPDGLINTSPSPFYFAHRRRIADFAANNRIPLMGAEREEAQEGALMAYGPIYAHIFRRAAAYVDRILRGAKPADLPVEQPTKFDMVINLKTAKALGLTIPQSVLMGADEVIK